MYNFFNFLTFGLSFFGGVIALMNLAKSINYMGKSIYYTKNLNKAREKYNWYSEEFTDEGLRLAMVKLMKDEFKIALSSLAFLIGLILIIIFL